MQARLIPRIRSDVFSNLGVDPASKTILLIKSTNHFYAGFAPIAEGIVYIDAGAPYPSHQIGRFPQSRRRSCEQDHTADQVDQPLLRRLRADRRRDRLYRCRRALSLASDRTFSPISASILRARPYC